MFNKGTNIFLNSGVASQAVLAAQLLANQIASQLAAENSKTNYHGRMGKSQKRLTNGEPSTTSIRRTRQMERSEFRQRNKKLYRAIREGVRAERKRIGRDVSSINDRMFATGM